METFFVSILFSSPLEGQVIGTLTGSALTLCERVASRLLGREWSLRCCSCWLGAGSRCGGRHRLGDRTTDDVVGTDIVKPTAVIFMGINVKLHRHILGSLNIELLDAILTKYAEYHPARILPRHFNDIILTHPGIACTL